MIRISAMLDTDHGVASTVAQAQRIKDAGFDGAYVSQIFGLDALSALSVVGALVPGLDLGTAVVPVFARHPQVMAQQALTVQSASGGRLTLGIGLSHQVVVEGMWGLSFDRPARYMAEYLSALRPLLDGECADVAGEVLTAKTFVPLSIDAPPPALLIAALAPAMLRLAGSRADGTITWMTGISTISSHVAPHLREAAGAAGRPAPRIVVALPVCLTDQPARASELIDAESAVYPSLPSYKAMLDKEGASAASEIGLIGSADELIDGIGRLAEAGGTELIAAISGTPDERSATFELLGNLASGAR
jgi:F420-dependent oxidoreductase-like protein